MRWKKMGVKHILLGIASVLVLLFAGCRYAPTGELECTPPSIKMLDVNGNSVCVLPEIRENATPAPTGQVIAPAPAANVTAPEQPAEVPTTPAVTPTPVVVTPSTPAAVAEMPRKTVKEGQVVDFPNLAATDPDGDKITYTFTQPLDANGEWQTKPGDAGEYKVTITASDGKNTVSQDILLVVERSNVPPVIQPIADITVKEGETVSLVPVVTDPDGDKVSVMYSGWMTGPSYKTTFDDAGNYRVLVTATDGIYNVSQEAKVAVLNVNRQPIVAPLADFTVTEGDKVVIEPTVTDPDGDALKFSFSKPLDQNGVWQTKQGDVGSYRVNVTASDASLSDSKSFTILVKSLNRPPTIDVEPEIIAKENDVVVLNPVVTDPDGDKVTVTYSGWMTSNTKQTTFDDAGEYIVTITATDGINKVSKDVKIVVQNVNRPPAFVPGSFQ
jgi:hypothetical protein